MRVTNSPEALPGSCGFCGSGQRSFYIDTGLNFEFHGAFYICNLCATELANLVGCSTEEQVTAAKAKLDQVESEKFNLQRLVDGLEKQIEGLTLARSASGSVPSANPVVVLSDPVAVDEPQSGENIVADGEGESSEQVHDEGMAELSDDAVPESSSFEFDF